MKTKIYFTVDTESSMGGAWDDPARRPVPADRHVFCRVGGREYGIPLIVDLLGRYGFRGTFFVETLATACLGLDDTRSIFDFLLRRGQDVQLHIHPTYHFYAESQKARAEGRTYQPPAKSDMIGRLPQDVQLALLSEAIRYFEECAGFRPSAFRAGSYAASRSMLQCLAQLGIAVDSSLNPCYPAVSFPGERLEPNQVRKIEGVWEIPVTVARTPLPEGHAGLKFADCTSLSFPELRTMLDDGAAAGQQHFVVVFHSFSAVKARDIAYSELRPNRIVIRRLEKLFGYLAANPDRFTVATMGEFAQTLPNEELSPSFGVVPELPLLPAALRKMVQLCNGGYWV
jgi:hypothetical protein